MLALLLVSRVRPGSVYRLSGSFELRLRERLRMFACGVVL
jgi:hypothetical protein